MQHVFILDLFLWENYRQIQVSEKIYFTHTQKKNEGRKRGCKEESWERKEGRKEEAVIKINKAKRWNLTAILTDQTC